MNYNIFIKNQSGTFNILDANEEELDKILDVYKYGKDTVFIKGKKYWFTKLHEIQIFTFEHQELKTEKDLWETCKSQDLIERGYLGFGEWLPIKILEKVGTRVTDDFITNDYGYLKDVKLGTSVKENYVDPERIDELNGIDDDDFDFTKLVAFLTELNIAYSHGLFLSIPPLVRAIIDHIPPVFNKANFADVCGSHGTHSFKESMKNLNSSSRKIADAFLHSHIRKQENLPNRTQINFSNDLDVLLQEIVRVRKK
ncbi:hypothetical protein JBL43_02345 [Aureibaculum sp. A20]|uniref:Uncharacterized protein n=1 Tax=Aureibaculum flavum TaxID=2795986 RepID=A0ABS0WM69_9FLAO|nr:hypothetical protein [Aureibaculum flavum]MBJ2173060.1 hypothetical protein [Aureibaculum flavum]